MPKPDPSITAPRAEGLEVTSRRLRRTVAILSVLSLGFYFLLVVVTLYTSWLDGYAFGSFSWAYVLGFAQFPFAIGCGLVYMRTAAAVDAENGGEDR
jgi:uncharacterized membrane protein (DUF485 family)